MKKKTLLICISIMVAITLIVGGIFFYISRDLKREKDINMQVEELDLSNSSEDIDDMFEDTSTEPNGDTDNKMTEEVLELSYPLVDTGFVAFYSNEKVIKEPIEGGDFYGQDATYQSNTPSYILNEDGTVIDRVTGIMWQQDMGVKMTYDEAMKKAKECTLGGYDDWRVASIKELYSLILFTGNGGGEMAGENRYIDTDYFIQPLGDTSIGEREIDAQTWSSTIYVGETMNGDKTVFGVNFIDGRIKGYPFYKKTQVNTAYFRFVRGNEEHGINETKKKIAGFKNTNCLIIPQFANITFI